MANINDITNAASYQGNANLGGGGSMVWDIDTKPVQQLATYSYLYNKSLFDQRQKDADEKIKTIAGLSAYDAAEGYGNDKDLVFKNISELRKKSAKFAATTWKNPDEKAKAYFDYQKDIADNIKFINSANGRKIKMDLYIATTQADPKLTAPEKELRINQAKKIFDETPIDTLPNFPQYDLTVPKVGEPVYNTVSVLKKSKDGNAVIQETKKEYSVIGNSKMSYLEGNNLMLPTQPSEDATQQEKDAFEQQKLAFSKTKLGGWQDAVEFSNMAVNDPAYKTTTTIPDTASGTNTVKEEIDFNKIKSSNPILGGVYKLAERFNNYVDNKIKDTQNGFYIDNVTGEQVLFTGDDKLEDLMSAKIDITKPLRPQDLSQLARFEAAQPDVIDKKLIETDDAIQKGQLREQERNNRQQTAIQWYNATKEGKNSNPKENQKFMDLTGYTGALTTADIAAIDPTLVVVENGLPKLSPAGQLATFKILPNGDVEVNYNNGEAAVGNTPEVKSTVKIINKAKYQKDAIEFTQTVLKDRKGEEGNPFTFTGQSVNTAPSEGKEGKVISSSKIKSLVGTKGYEGYTEKELIDYYESNGYKVKQ